jgi:ubiquinone/menaquinone biosynthesis C-methylase UbiE
MKRFALEALRCPHDGTTLTISNAKRWDSDDLVEGKLSCAMSHEWNVSEGLPSLVSINEVSEEDIKWIREYDEQAKRYDESIKIYDAFLRTNMAEGRRQLMKHVPTGEGAKIIDISIGTALNFVALSQIDPVGISKTILHGIDLSRGMLKVARRKLEAKGLTTVLVHADVNKKYPFPDNYFDAVICTGGINTYSDIPRAFSEILRIAKPGSIAVISDEGLSPEQEKTEFGQWVISQNSLFRSKPPLDKIPKDVKKLDHWWIMNDAFYAITFHKPS